MIFIGIDPGLEGAIAVLDDQGELVGVQDTPTLTVEGGTKTKRLYNLPAIVSMVSMCPAGQCRAALEQVHAMPDQGIVGAFSFGQGFGNWQGILAALHVPVHEVPPQTWKKAMMNGMGKDKDASRLRVLQLYPSASEQVSLKKHHGRADAILIARWLWTTQR